MKGCSNTVSPNTAFVQRICKVSVSCGTYRNYLASFTSVAVESCKVTYNLNWGVLHLLTNNVHIGLMLCFGERRWI